MAKTWKDILLDYQNIFERRDDINDALAELFAAPAIKELDAYEVEKLLNFLSKDTDFLNEVNQKAINAIMKAGFTTEVIMRNGPDVVNNPSITENIFMFDYSNLKEVYLPNCTTTYTWNYVVGVYAKYVSTIYLPKLVKTDSDNFWLYYSSNDKNKFVIETNKEMYNMVKRTRDEFYTNDPIMRKMFTRVLKGIVVV